MDWNQIYFGLLGQVFQLTFFFYTVKKLEGMSSERADFTFFNRNGPLKKPKREAL